MFSFSSATDVGLETVADLLTRSFAGYAVPISVTAASLIVATRVDSVDPALSRVATRDGELLGAALVARRGGATRLASMAVVPAGRRQGVARALVHAVIEEARERGDRTIELEVIEQNVPAVTLYESAGFRTRRRLVGFEGEPASTRDTVVLEPASAADVAAAVRDGGAPDLPWQVSADTIEELGSPWVGVRAGPTFALVSDPAAETITLRALVTAKTERRRGHARRALEALFARHPGKRWRVSALCPEEEGPVLRSVGLARTALSQLQMTRELRAGSPEEPRRC